MIRINSRTSARAIYRMFLERWSPRAFTDAPIGEADLLTILEAARWSSSSKNANPGASSMPCATLHPGMAFLDLALSR